MHFMYVIYIHVDKPWKHMLSETSQTYRTTYCPEQANPQTLRCLGWGSEGIGQCQLKGA